MDYATGVLLQSQALQHQVVPCGPVVMAQQVIGPSILDRYFNEFVLLSRGLEDVRVGRLAYLALKLSELVAADVGVLLERPLGLDPLLETLVVHVLHSAAALARGEERVILSCLVDPTEAAKRQLFVETLHLQFLTFLLLEGLCICDLALLVGVHLGYYLLTLIVLQSVVCNDVFSESVFHEGSLALNQLVVL